ncbi:MAG: cytochrome c [Nitrospirae bacterium]|nr:cytochrome c [Nitrospirota bacterium]
MDRTNKKIALLGTAFFGVFLLLGMLAFIPGGEDLFRQQRCITCHRFKGQGGMAGPDLTEVFKRRNTVWIVHQIRNPRSHNPDSRMPSYENLDILDIYALISYLKS